MSESNALARKNESPRKGVDFNIFNGNEIQIMPDALKSLNALPPEQQATYVRKLTKIVEQVTAVTIIESLGEIDLLASGLEIPEPKKGPDVKGKRTEIKLKAVKPKEGEIKPISSTGEDSSSGVRSLVDDKAPTRLMSAAAPRKGSFTRAPEALTIPLRAVRPKNSVEDDREIKTEDLIEVTPEEEALLLAKIKAYKEKK